MVMTTASAVWILAFLLVPPLVAAVLYVLPRLPGQLRIPIVRPALAALAFSCSYVRKPWYQEVFFEDYRGVDRGFGVTIPDFLFFGFLIWLLIGGDGWRKRVWWPTNTTLFLALLAVSCLSLLQSQVSYFGFFTIHKFVRGLILYWVVVNLVHDRKDVVAVLSGVFLSILFQFGLVIYDKYVTGAVVNRVVGAFPHPNSLAMYCELVIPVALALVIVGTRSRRLNLVCALTVIAGVICVIFTKSRASLAIMSTTICLVPLVCFLIRPSVRVVGVIAAGLLVMSAIGAAAAPQILERFHEAPKESEQTREYFNNAAVAMADHYRFGTGINSYSWMLANTRYYWYVYPDKIGIENPRAFRYSARGKSRLGTCHNIYLLFAAETGWIGMIVFLLFILRFYVHNLWHYLRAIDPEYKAILLGLLAGFWSIHLQGTLEWVWRQTAFFYLFILLSGLMVAIARLQPRRQVVLSRA